MRYDEDGYDIIGFRGIPAKVIYDTSKGRPRKTPYKTLDNRKLKKVLDKSMDEFSKENKRAYDRMAQRKNYNKKKAFDMSGQTAAGYKMKLNKKMKDFSKQEMSMYNKLAKREERIRKK